MREFYLGSFKGDQLQRMMIHINHALSVPGPHNRRKSFVHVHFCRRISSLYSKNRIFIE